jgi:hypothetical protein
MKPFVAVVGEPERLRKQELVPIVQEQGVSNKKRGYFKKNKPD